MIEYLNLAGLAVVIAFLWHLQRDFHKGIPELKGRMARLDSLMEGFVQRALRET